MSLRISIYTSIKPQLPSWYRYASLNKTCKIAGIEKLKIKDAKIKPGVSALTQDKVIFKRRSTSRQYFILQYAYFTGEV